jgi:hypothetical protein
VRRILELTVKKDLNEEEKSVTREECRRASSFVRVSSFCILYLTVYSVQAPVLARLDAADQWLRQMWLLPFITMEVCSPPRTAACDPPPTLAVYSLLLWYTGCLRRLLTASAKLSPRTA